MKKLLSCVLLLGLPLSGVADVVGVHANAHYWYTDADGSLEAPDYNGYSLQLDENTLKGESNAMVSVAIEHPVPFLPNIRLAHTRIRHSGQGELVYNNTTYSMKGEIDLSHTDITGYYELPVPVVSLDLGLTGRFYDGYLHSDVANANLDSQYLLIYLAGRFDLPLTGLAIGADINAGDNGNERGVDIDTYLQYTGTLGLGVIAGYRSLDIDLESTASAAGNKVDLLAQFKVTGPYLGITYRF